MATYVNNLRLKEIATGDESGTWGTSTNTNLELIAEAFSFGTEAITTNADTHTTTIADGSTDDTPVCFPDMVVNTDARDAGVGVRDHKKPCAECMGLPGRDSFACYQIYLLVQYNKE